jgi:hypothetical protein
MPYECIVPSAAAKEFSGPGAVVFGIRSGSVSDAGLTGAWTADGALRPLSDILLGQKRGHKQNLSFRRMRKWRFGHTRKSQSPRSWWRRMITTN